MIDCIGPIPVGLSECGSAYGFAKYLKGSAYIHQALIRVQNARTVASVFSKNMSQRSKDWRTIKKLQKEKFKQLDIDLDEKAKGCGQRLDRMHAIIRPRLEGKKVELETSFEDA